jgi:mono/diheme cytochrome c family protein
MAPSATRFPLAVAVLVAISAGMASAKDAPGPSVAAQRGYRVAARECSSCHAVDRLGESPKPTAPPFRDIRRRYNELSLAREFQAISEVGHYEMPAKPISKGDGEDLIAYIESLGR